MPVSGIARGKTRLAPVLSAAERGRLNRQLVRHAVRTLLGALGSAAPCIVVSPCERALRIAREAGALGLPEHRPGRGLNAAVRQAIRYAARRGARRVLVLPADLPLASVAQLRALLRRTGPLARSLLVPDRERSGTNAILLHAGPDPQPRFGPQSFAKHLDAARAAGREPVIFELPGLVQDLDTPGHLAGWRSAGMRWGR